MNDNLKIILDEVEGLFDKLFKHNDKTYNFFGIVIGSDDLYYGMIELGTGKLLLLTCVGNLDSHEFELIGDFVND